MASLPGLLRLLLAERVMVASAISKLGDRREILGVPVCVASLEDSVLQVEHLIQSGGSHLVATADASGIVIAQEDSDLMRIYQEASWVTADSNGVIWALRRQGITAERVSGVDLADRLLALSAAKGYSVYLLGAAPGVAEAARERMMIKYPGCNIIGAQHGHFPESENEFVAKQLVEVKPDILLVAMGIPRQEKFIDEARKHIQFGIAMGVGGTLDVMSGKVKRAPVIIQKLKIEWLWRTLLNPKKFSKAKTLPVFVRLVKQSEKKK